MWGMIGSKRPVGPGRALEIYRRDVKGITLLLLRDRDTEGGRVCASVRREGT